jgi:hypothetical protein
MSKQTAIEWLEQEFIKLEATIGVHCKMYELLERAKTMEKQQIIAKNQIYGVDLSGLQYYEKTFKD